MPFNPFTALTSKIYGGLALAALVFAGVQTLRIEGLWFVHGFKDEVAGLRQTLAEVKANAAVATRDQVAANQLPQTRSAEIAHDHDTPRPNHLEALDRAARYADANRVWPEGAGGACGQADTSETDRSSENRDRPGPAADHVAVTRNDYDILIANSLRLQRVNEWANELVKEKLAIPEVEFGPPPEEPAP